MSVIYSKIQNAKRKLVTVAVPYRSRDNEKSLFEFFENIQGNAYDNNRIEYLLRMDSDDKRAVDLCDELMSRFTNVFIKIGPRPARGAAQLHELYKELYSYSNSDFFWICNDDVVIETKNWDKVIEKWVNKPCLLNCINFDNGKLLRLSAVLWPIINRDVIETIGSVCPVGVATDYFWELVYANTKIGEKINVTIKHRIGPERDRTDEEYYKAYRLEHDRLNNRTLLTHEREIMKDVYKKISEAYG